MVCLRNACADFSIAIQGLWWLVEREKPTKGVLSKQAKKPRIVVDLETSHHEVIELDTSCEIVDLCDEKEEGDTSSLSYAGDDGVHVDGQFNESEDIHPMWKPAQFPDGTKFYYSDYNEAIRYVNMSLEF